MQSLLDRLQQSPTFIDSETGFSLDVSGLDPDPELLASLTGKNDATGMSRLAEAHLEMEKIEAGEIKNPDEQRRVTHFTDRHEYADSSLYHSVQELAAETAADPRIEYVIINGIGGSALGPQFVHTAINGLYWNELTARQRRGFPRLYFLDNTDSAGLIDVLAVVDLKKTLVVTISKSGSTKETHNNMIALEQAYDAAGYNFAHHAVAVTMADSHLDRYAGTAGWRKVFPLADSIGGRTSETNIVGHLPGALTGIDFKALLDGACRMDQLTRRPDTADNPAYQLAVSWYLAGHGRGDRNLVVVPYSDRLALFGKYLQQLIMESLGKELDRSGRRVCQGLTVYGNKGGTDAHAYIQQLNDGRDDFVVTFIEPLKDAAQIEIENGLTMGDYLHAFKQGLINALRGKQRKVIDLQIAAVNEFNLGLLIALFERAVAFYAELININAFHQPGVQAYKKASDEINQLLIRLHGWIGSLENDFTGTAATISTLVDAPEQTAAIGGLLDKLAGNQREFKGRAISRTGSSEGWTYRITVLNNSLNP